MPTTITFRRGTAAPTSGSGLTLGEPAFDSSLKRFYIGQGTGVTAVWVGAQISGLSSDIAAGLTYQIPTMGAVKDYVASTTSGVASLNSQTGAITLVAGTNIGVTTASGSITITNQGVQSFNGLTGAVAGVTTSTANTFTAAQTFNAGITTSTLDVTGQAKFNGNVNFGDAAADVMTVTGGMTIGSSLDVTGAAKFNGGLTASRIDITGNFKVIGDSQVGDANTDVFTVFSGTTFNNRTDFAGSNNFAGAARFTGGATFSSRIDSNNSIVFTGVGSGFINGYNTLSISGTTTAATGTNQGPGQVQLSLGGVTIGSAGGLINFYPTSVDGGQSRLALWYNDGVSTHSTTITPTQTANRTITLPDATGTVALTSTSVASVSGLTGAVTINAGTAIGITTSGTNLTVTNQGVQSFNGLTGAVAGVTTSTANTFTAAQTFNAGITTSTLDVTGQAKFNGNVNFGDAAADVMTVNGGMTVGSSLDVTGVAKFNGNVTIGDASSDVLTVTAGATFGVTDHSGAARFASTVTVTGAVTANGGLTASTIDVSGAARLASTLAVTGVLTQTGGATFASTTDHTGAARFASTITATGAVIANGGLTASAIFVTSGVTIGGNLTVTGNLQIDGTTTTINSTTLLIDDKLIELAHSPSGATGNDAAVNGGGMQLNSTQGNKTFTYNSTTPAWVSSENMDLASGKTYKINTADVLSSTTLGSTVVSSSLTSVGTIGTGVWQGTVVGVTYGGTGLASYTIGDVLYASNTGTLAKLSTTTAGYLLAANGAGAAPEYKQLLVRDASANSIATVSSGSGTLTATIQNATTTLRGVASFDSANFTVSSGAVSITGIDGGSYA